MTAQNKHSHLLHADQTLLVVVDMQEPFLRTIFEKERVFRNVGMLIAGANTLRIPVLGTTQYAVRMGEIVPEIRRLLPPVPAIDKMTFSCYDDPAFAAAVDQSGRKQILLCGVESHICINQTAHGLLAANFQVHVVADAVSSRSESNWRQGIDKMTQSGVLISTVEMALYEILREGGTTAFREILQIIK